jgi:uncharacterized coiled-coil DUF342 family protein
MIDENSPKGKIMTDKDAYVQKLHRKLDEWNAEIDRLKARGDQAEAKGRAEYHKQIQELTERRQAAQKKLEEMRQAGESAWEDLKSGVQNAWDAMEAAVKSARSRLK